MILSSAMAYQKLKLVKEQYLMQKNMRPLHKLKLPQKKMVGKIIDVVENGYLIGDKILRYPKVVVGN